MGRTKEQMSRKDRRMRPKEGKVNSSVVAATALRVLTAIRRDARFKSTAFTLQAEVVVVIELQHDSKTLQIDPGT